MSKKANPMVIGAFIVGALVLLVAGTLIFGTGKFFRERSAYVLFFEGSIKGLDVGAPVMFRGVKIGSVSDIQLKVDAEEYHLWIPVYIELEQGRATLMGEERDVDIAIKTTEDFTRVMIDRGLRAQLQLQSVVTSKLFVALDLFPDHPANFVGLEKKVPEIPTVPRTMQEISDTATKIIEEIKKIPFEKLFNKLVDTIEGIDEVVQSPEFKESFRSLNQTLKDLQKLVRNVDSKIDPIVSDAQETAGAARAALNQIQETLEALESTTSEDSELHYELSDTLKEVSAAARSIRVLSDYLAQKPDALLRGKGRSGGQ
jgi:paraquat-inducible protein B